jgi:UTRA domain-containing protein
VDSNPASLPFARAFDDRDIAIDWELCESLDENIDATVADPRLAKLLSVPRGSPLLRIRHVIFSKTGKAITCVLGTYRSERHTVNIRRTR